MCINPRGLGTISGLSRLQDFETVWDFLVIVWGACFGMCFITLSDADVFLTVFETGLRPIKP